MPARKIILLDLTLIGTTGANINQINMTMTHMHIVNGPNTPRSATRQSTRPCRPSASRSFSGGIAWRTRQESSSSKDPSSNHSSIKI